MGNERQPEKSGIKTHHFSSFLVVFHSGRTLTKSAYANNRCVPSSGILKTDDWKCDVFLLGHKASLPQ
jgi:hypothetical protein